MRKSTKWVVYGIVILIIAAAILFVWVYPQLDRSAQQTIRDIQTGALADDTQTESPTVDGHTEAENGGVPTAAPEALAVGLRGVGETIHDTETMGEGSRDYTLNRVDVYDTIEDSPISLSECVPNTSYDTYQTWKFILLDMNVTNTSESEMEPRAGEEYQFMLDLIPRNEGDSQMLYFSEHPDSTNSASDYNKFNLAPGVVCSKRLLNQAVGKSLRTHNLKPKKGAQVMRKNEKITALYERLSRDDFGKDDDQQRESNSISNQKAMLEEFAARQGFTNIVHFTDDGISGTCFVEVR